MAKVIHAWCQHHEIPDTEAIFIWRGRALLLEESARSLGHDAASSLTVSAVPRDSPDAAAALEALDRDKSFVLAAIAAAAESLPRAPTQLGSAAAPGRAARSAAAPAPSSPPPKKPSTSYLLFTTKRRPELLAGRPELQGSTNIGEVSKLLAADWKALPEDGRRVFEAQAAEARAAHSEAMATYRVRHPDAATGASPGSAAKRKKAAGSQKSGKPRKARRSGAAGASEAGDTDGEVSSESSDVQGRQEPKDVADAKRRSARLAESPMAALAGSVTIVHHPPPVKRRKSKVEELHSPGRPAASEDEPEPERMTYKEYLTHDRELQRKHQEAKKDRQKLREINGADSDEDLQVALALSLSESQGS